MSYQAHESRKNAWFANVKFLRKRYDQDCGAGAQAILDGWRIQKFQMVEPEPEIWAEVQQT